MRRLWGFLPFSGGPSLSPESASPVPTIPCHQLSYCGDKLMASVGVTLCLAGYPIRMGDGKRPSERKIKNSVGQFCVVGNAAILLF